MSEPNKQQPSVGRAVHYVSHGTPIGPDGEQRFASRCRAATVTEVGDDQVVGLMVANPSGLFFHQLSDGGSAHDQGEKAAGTWHWPERV